jgi:hypothetical protein
MQWQDNVRPHGSQSGVQLLILFTGEGRLGNQVFQYAALNSIAGPESRVVAVGLEDLSRAFELSGPRLSVVPGGRWTKRLFKFVFVPLLLRPLARLLRLISYAREPDSAGPHAGSGGCLQLHPGLFRGVVFVDGGYYQNSEYWPDLFPPRGLRLREYWRAEARRVMGSPAGGAARPIFLHVRRADFVGFTTYGLGDLLLPAAYFRKAVEEVRSRLGARRLLIVTDDAAWVEREFADIPDREVVSGSPLVDFAVMTECAAGILSNSTFSLAAALFMRDPELILGPEYWFGFRVQQWLPPRIRFEHARIRYLSIPEAA